jgi:ABC-type nitrate/sulfonate/bicarbonate transport system substrate-binding protein
MRAWGTTLPRLASAAATLVGGLAMTVVPAPGRQLETIALSSFGTPRAVAQARDLGMLERRGIRVEVSPTQSSEQQAQELLDGRWDITSSDADNYVYWTEDRGADFFIFLVGQGVVDNQFYVTPAIQNFDDLRGKTIAVDSAFSGQSTILRTVLLRNGLEIDRDYRFLPVGSSPLRAAAIREGRAVGANLSQAAAESPDGVAASLRLFARGSDYVPIYPTGTMATTRRWAVAHPGLLVDFIGALIDTQEWLLNPANAEAAIASIARTDRVSEERATQLYREAVASIGSLGIEDQVREDMIGVVLDLRAEVGLMARPTSAPSKYVSAEWYALAWRLRGQSGM